MAFAYTCTFVVNSGNIVAWNTDAQWAKIWKKGNLFASAFFEFF